MNTLSSHPPMWVGFLLHFSRESTTLHSTTRFVRPCSLGPSLHAAVYLFIGKRYAASGCKLLFVITVSSLHLTLMASWRRIHVSPSMPTLPFP